MVFSTVYEDPWIRNHLQLGQVAVQHLELIETFLKLLPYLGDRNSRISDETLAYSEWRYVMYLRFIDARGFSPNDHPPPWDVALIMYLHMLSPSRFHQYIYNNRHRVETGIYGLEHRHFPMTKLLTGEWCPSPTQKLWDEWNMPSGSSCRGPNLAYQLWPHPPWDSKKHLFSRMLGRDANRVPCSGREWSIPTDARTEGMIQHHDRRVIVMQNGFRCRTPISEKGYKVWDLQSYAAVRTRRVEERCRSQSIHEEFNEICALKPWPSLQDLRADLEQQISFWRVITNAKNSISRFIDNLTNSVDDYEHFLGLLEGKLPKNSGYGTYKSKYKSKLDSKPDASAQISGSPDPRLTRLLPPTLEIDLLWHTHRLYPATYWAWSFEKADWLLESERLPNTQAATLRLEHTKEAYSKCSVTLGKGTAIEQWFIEYVPSIMKHAAHNVMRTDLPCVLSGRGANRHRRVPRKGGRIDPRNDATGGGGAGDYGGPGSYDGGGDGGGGGGE
ncbi:hypothetical protein F53441_6379 [Fusarium austroafricanum]|uniref:Uncharacterized protein n=1 Tax=Fusarium austroafricanum TaxID=2364996 RepID=A0A8H4NTF7_9HYPO|nr:hypothetical protein F53441_6379 [Fusarium austroafricanum]